MCVCLSLFLLASNSSTHRRLVLSETAWQSCIFNVTSQTANNVRRAGALCWSGGWRRTERIKLLTRHKTWLQQLCKVQHLSQNSNFDEVYSDPLWHTDTETANTQPVFVRVRDHNLALKDNIFEYTKAPQNHLSANFKALECTNALFLIPTLGDTANQHQAKWMVLLDWLLCNQYHVRYWLHCNACTSFSIF